MIPQNPYQPKNGWYTTDQPHQVGHGGANLPNSTRIPYQREPILGQVSNANPFASENPAPIIVRPSTFQTPASQNLGPSRNPFLDESISQPVQDPARIARAPPTEELSPNRDPDFHNQPKQPNNSFAAPMSVNNSPNTSQAAVNKLNKSEEDRLNTCIQGLKQKLEQTEDKWNHLKEKYRTVKKEKESLQMELGQLQKKCEVLESSAKSQHSDSRSSSIAELEKLNGQYYARITEIEDINTRIKNELEECQQKLAGERKKYDKLKKETDHMNKSDSEVSRTNIMQIMLPLSMDNESRDISPNQEKLIKDLMKQLKEKDARIQELQRKFESSQEIQTQLTQKLLLSSAPLQPKVAALPQPEQRPPTKTIGLNTDPSLSPWNALPGKDKPVTRSVMTETPPLPTQLTELRPPAASPTAAPLHSQPPPTLTTTPAPTLTTTPAAPTATTPATPASPTNSSTSVSAAPVSSLAPLIEPLKLKLDETLNNLRSVSAENRLLRERLEELILECDRLKEGGAGTSIRMVIDPGSVLADVSFSDAGGAGNNVFFPDREKQENAGDNPQPRDSAAPGSGKKDEAARDRERDQQKFSDGGDKSGDRDGNWKKSKSGDNRKDYDKDDLRYPAGYAKEDPKSDRDRKPNKDKPWDQHRDHYDDWRDDDRDQRLGGYRTHNSERNVPHVSSRGQTRGYGGEFRGGKAGSSRGRGRFQYESSDYDHYISDEEDGYQRNHRGGGGKR